MQRSVLYTLCLVVAALAIWLLVETRDSGRDSGRAATSPPEHAKGVASAASPGAPPSHAMPASPQSPPMPAASTAGNPDQAPPAAESASATAAAAPAEVGVAPQGGAQGGVERALHDLARRGEVSTGGVPSRMTPGAVAGGPAPAAAAVPAATSDTAKPGAPAPVKDAATSSSASSNAPVVGGALTPEQINEIAKQKVPDGSMPPDEIEPARANARNEAARNNKVAMDLTGATHPAQPSATPNP